MRENYEGWLKTHPPRRRASPSRVSGIPQRLISMSAEGV
jgi:hypothetical protein